MLVIIPHGPLLSIPLFQQGPVCFAKIRFQRRRIKLPLFELDW